MKQLLNIILASIMLVGAVPAIQANAEPAQPASSPFSYFTMPVGIAALAIGMIVMNAEYWEKVMGKPSATRWDKLRNAQRGFVSGWFNYVTGNLRYYGDKYRRFFGLDAADQNPGGDNGEQFDVRTHPQKEQEREDRELARRLNEQADREYARRMQDQWNNEARPANNARRPVRR